MPRRRSSTERLATTKAVVADMHASDQAAEERANREREERSRLPLSQIQLRHTDTRELSSKHVEALAESITHLGLLEPLVVDKTGRLLAGGHRLAALKLLQERQPKNFESWFADGIPVRVLNIDAEVETERALAIEVAENEQRRDYTPAEVRTLADRLRRAGYVERAGRPARGEKALKPALQVIIGKSWHQVHRYLNVEKQKTLASARVSKAEHHLIKAATELKAWLAQPEKQRQTEPKKALANNLPQLLELIKKVLDESKG
ncbi:ParB N-terminal domain-containing protein [Trichocoleus sp. FACHB-262]|uniref:ParB N-terminal domain-containing protein n=1 Tax=Trichocoleus sp. FACHB-262 TaxID=2692869 RepID=UPI001684FAEB|nr:ParB N-terminal domain-containing protein [Trichocoleus sp. FACHB-262]MBD2124764.1 ParB N-terminal domain-containing protein [Trichocoleus sp. FACHB-262]